MDLQKQSEFCKQTLELKQNIEVTFLEFGARLSYIKSNDLWKSQWESWEYYLEEAKLSPATASKLINIYEKFVVEYQIQPKDIAIAGGWSSVSEVLPMVKDKVSALEWLNKVATLTRKDLRDEMLEKKTGIPQSSTEYDDDVYYLKIWRVTGKKIQIPEDMISEEIKNLR